MKNRARIILLLLGDIIALTLAFWAMLYISFLGRLDQKIINLHLMPFLFLGILWILIFFMFNLYNTQSAKPTIPNLKQIFLAFIVASVLGVIFFYTIPFWSIAPKKNLFIFATVAILFFILWRRIFYNIFSYYFRKNVVFIISNIDNNLYVRDLIEYISTYPQSGFFITGKYSSIEQFSKEHKNIPQVFIIAKEVWRNSENFKKLSDTHSQILDLAQAYEDILGRIPIETIDESWFIHNINSYQEDTINISTRIFGILIASLILIITSPLLLIVSLLIKIYDRGPIFYTQNRVGKNGKNFKLYKFRSMIINAEKNGPEWSNKKDYRVTPIGKILRKLHFDEIPQMWNIIKGDIALVGPRPERPEFVSELEKEIPFYYLRHTITPGFTGWAQIKFRYAGNIMDSKEKFEYDLYYLKNKNIFMDFGILVRTIQIIFFH